MYLKKIQEIFYQGSEIHVTFLHSCYVPGNKLEDSAGVASFDQILSEIRRQFWRKHLEWFSDKARTGEMRNIPSDRKGTCQGSDMEEYQKICKEEWVSGFVS